ncbi:hypothetical protein C0Q70_11474 [Pomacea canaliculata]|uniref:Uncharacterized protein n=1 Tax=Pomacea canaliculata TaxID=400727 RepID=A0A2T7P628_POMCA|nr:hypothetical protein C0Q70_11474 [Pomacea canaliculata]
MPAKQGEDKWKEGSPVNWRVLATVLVKLRSSPNSFSCPAGPLEDVPPPRKMEFCQPPIASALSCLDKSSGFLHR